jgi:heptaprenyl diphosphate synthase
MALIAVLIAQAIVLGFIERMIPVNFIVPGAKLGLANIITLVALYILTFRETTLVLVGRVVLIALLFGSVSSLLYSLSGGVLALLGMYLAKKTGKISIIGISIIGAVMHNIGQLLMASLVISNLNMFYYLPFLLVFALPTGLIIGLTSRLIIKYLEQRKEFQSTEKTKGA